MDWYILMIGFPMIVIPIVLLCGYAGCAQIAGISDSNPPPAPTSVTAKALGPTKVRLTWSVAPYATFNVVRARDPGQFNPVDSVQGVAFEDDGRPGLIEGTTFRYQVTKTEDELIQGYEGTSGPSKQVKVTTLPDTPTNLTRTSAVPGQVGLSWMNVSVKADKIRIESRTPPGAGGFTTVGIVAGLTPQTIPSTFQHNDAATLTAGSSHEYRLVAIVTQGFDNNVPKPAVESPPSGILTVSIPSA